MKAKRGCGFEARERVARKGCWSDPRWHEVRRLRAEGKQSETNGL
jgi:hypothetical protein